MRLFVLFLAVPVIEIGLFIQVGGLIGLWPTLAIVILTAVLGTWMIRKQGVLAMSQIRSSFSELRDPTEPLAHGAMILISGALLLTPGFFTDAVGFLLLIPPFRSAVYTYFRSRISVQSFETQQDNRRNFDENETIIDGDFEELDGSSHQGPTGNSGWTRH